MLPSYSRRISVDFYQRGIESPARRGRRPSPALTLGTLSDQRHKLLDLYYAGKISADGFKEEEDRLCTDIEIARTQAAEEQSVERAKNDLEARFEQVAAIPQGPRHRDRLECCRVSREARPGRRVAGVGNCFPGPPGGHGDRCTCAKYSVRGDWT